VIELSERLSALTGLGHVFYASDGASATEIALKMSFHYWKNIGQPEKCRFISLDNSYHGETAGALAVTDVPLFSATYAPLLKPGVRAIAGCETGRPGQSAMWPPPFVHWKMCWQRRLARWRPSLWSRWCRVRPAWPCTTRFT
jgi:adenosylmethionine-8-amino-7-oxononanoate aminotransferase